VTVPAANPLKTHLLHIKHAIPSSATVTVPAVMTHPVAALKATVMARVEMNR